jgi:hypothetical protein
MCTVCYNLQFCSQIISNLGPTEVDLWPECRSNWLRDVSCGRSVEVTGSEKYHVTASLLNDVEFVRFVVVALNHKVTLLMIL